MAVKPLSLSPVGRPAQSFNKFTISISISSALAQAAELLLSVITDVQQ